MSARNQQSPHATASRVSTVNDWLLKRERGHWRMSRGKPLAFERTWRDFENSARPRKPLMQLFAHAGAHARNAGVNWRDNRFRQPSMHL
jgi:hypothetical protein